MSAIRLRETPKGLEVRVDDESPQSAEPIMLQVLPGHVAPPTLVNLTLADAEELRDALQWAIVDARTWLSREKP